MSNLQHNGNALKLDMGTNSKSQVEFWLQNLEQNW